LNQNPFARPFNFTSRNLQTTNDRSHQRSSKTINPFARPSSKTTNDRSRFFIAVSGFGFLQFSASQQRATTRRDDDQERRPEGTKIEGFSTLLGKNHKKMTPNTNLPSILGF
ncbi:unnamed protein product, partial [Prunus brigantina]